MSIEPYQWLLANSKELGFIEENIGPASVDLCLLEEIRVKSIGEKDRVIEIPEPNGKFAWFTFRPHYFYLCSTVEYIKVPETHCALINMRSSLARKGLGHKMAGFIDPGFEGQVTLELETSIPVEVKFR